MLIVQKNCIEEALKLLIRANERIGVENVMSSAVNTLEAACEAKHFDFPYKTMVSV